MPDESTAVEAVLSPEPVSSDVTTIGQGCMHIDKKALGAKDRLAYWHEYLVRTFGKALTLSHQPLGPFAM